MTIKELRRKQSKEKAVLEDTLRLLVYLYLSDMGTISFVSWFSYLS